MPFPYIPFDDIVDLTMSGDEDEPQEVYRRPSAVTGWALSTPLRTQPAPTRTGPASPPQPTRTPGGSSLTPTRPPARNDELAPSKTARFSQAPATEIPAPVPAVSDADGSGGTPRGPQAAQTSTPVKAGWTVESIATRLASLAPEVNKTHGRIVHYCLQEAFKSAHEPRHLSSIDAFAGMPPIAVDPDEAVGPTMVVKFKVGYWVRSSQKKKKLYPSYHASSYLSSMANGKH